ncbi:hypothetical protein JHK84_051223 [Glycine max]|nr:hypothetical protein JHK85_052052 [Glycine max]KAG5095635.1 hypothetical protein JHK84_051223 [Glycine max]
MSNCSAIYHEDDESTIFSSGIFEKISSIENLEKFRSSEELVQFLKDGQAIQEIVSKDGDHESNDEQITFE